VRGLVLIGIIVAAVGTFILLRGATYPQKHDLVKVGDVKASVTDHHPVPTWVGAVALVGGIVLVGAGARGKSA